MEDERVLKAAYESASERSGFLKELLPFVVGAAGVVFAVFYLVFAKLVDLVGAGDAVGDFVAGAGFAQLAGVASFVVFVVCVVFLIGAALEVSLFAANWYLKKEDPEADIHAKVFPEPVPRHLLPMVDAAAKQALKDRNVKAFSLRYVDAERRWSYVLSTWRIYPLVFFAAALLVAGLRWLVER